MAPRNEKDDPATARSGRGTRSSPARLRGAGANDLDRPPLEPIAFLRRPVTWTISLSFRQVTTAAALEGSFLTLRQSPPALASAVAPSQIGPCPQGHPFRGFQTV